MLILYIYFCFVFHSSTPNRICGAEVWHTSAAIARELSYSYRRSFSDDQIGLTDQFFEFRLLAFTLARLIFLHCMCFGVSSTYFAFVFQEWTSPAGTHDKVYNSMNMSGFLRSLSLSSVEKRKQRHLTWDIVNFKIFPSTGYLHRNPSDTVHQTDILWPQVESHYDQELKGSWITAKSPTEPNWTFL